MKRRDFLQKTLAGAGALPAVRWCHWRGSEPSGSPSYSPRTAGNAPALIPLPQHVTWADCWDYKHSEVWLNGERIDPPRWSKPGRRGHNEAPYLDESYEYRTPNPVSLSASWNQILLKAPIGDFSSEHTRLVKWMFSAVLVEWSEGRLRALNDVEYASHPPWSSQKGAAPK
jgi:hypothetical protein